MGAPGESSHRLANGRYAGARSPTVGHTRHLLVDLVLFGRPGALSSSVLDTEPAVNLYGRFGPGGDDAVGEPDAYATLLTEWVEPVADLAANHGADVGSVVDTLGERWRSPTVERGVTGALAYRRRGVVRR